MQLALAEPFLGEGDRWRDVVFEAQWGIRGMGEWVWKEWYCGGILKDVYEAVEVLEAKGATRRKVRERA
eukprot:6893676-Lingulodinium_polyedra.AAC.1